MVSYYEMCQNERSRTKEELDLNHFFGQKSLQETASSIGDTKLEEEVDYLNSKGITTVEDYRNSLTTTNRRLESIHMKNILLIYVGLTFLAFSKKEAKQAILIKQ